MAGSRTARRLLVQERELAGSRVDGECAHHARLLAPELSDLANRVEELPIGMNGQEGRADRFRGQSGGAELTAGKVQLGLIDSLAASPGVRPNINSELAGHGFFLIRCLAPGRKTAEAGKNDQHGEETKICEDHGSLKFGWFDNDTHSARPPGTGSFSAGLIVALPPRAKAEKCACPLAACTRPL